MQLSTCNFEVIYSLTWRCLADTLFMVLHTGSHYYSATLERDVSVTNVRRSQINLPNPPILYHNFFTLSPLHLPLTTPSAEELSSGCNAG